MELPGLNLPEFEPSTERIGDTVFIQDIIRKKKLVLTPEEWVRQNILNLFIRHLEYPSSMIAIEKGLKVNRMTRRSDILVYHGTRPRLLVECKAPEVRIDEKAFHQACRYNLTLQVPFLLISNGIDHWMARIREGNPPVEFMDHIPHYSELK